MSWSISRALTSKMQYSGLHADLKQALTALMGICLRLRTDCGDLAPVAPLRQESEHEGLHEDRRKHRLARQYAL